MTAETSDTVASIAGSLLHIQAHDIEEMSQIGLDNLTAKVRSLAASALRQHEPDETVPVFETKREIVTVLEDMFAKAFREGFVVPEDFKAKCSQALMQLAAEPEGLRVNLIDVFSSWGEREAKDTAMLMDLCLGAAIEQLVPFTVPDAMWPAFVEIDGKALERLATEQRIVRLQPEVGKWRIRLLPPDLDTEEPPEVVRNEEWAKLGWLRRHITAFEDYHSQYETMADAMGEAGSTAYHEERRKLGQALLALLDGRSALIDEPPSLVPGETAASTIDLAEGNGTKKRD